MDNNGSAKLMELLKSPRSQATKEEEADDELLCFGNVRGNRRAFNIEFRRLQGSWPMLEYAWLQRAEWCPVETTLVGGVVTAPGSFLLRYSSGEIIVVAGRNLRPVYQLLMEHQVKYLAEADRASDRLVQDDTPVVTRLQVIEPSLSGR